jgi:hypothetical protein
MIRKFLGRYDTGWGIKSRGRVWGRGGGAPPGYDDNIKNIGDLLNLVEE